MSRCAPIATLGGILWLTGCAPPSTLGLMTDGLEPAARQVDVLGLGGVGYSPNLYRNGGSATVGGGGLGLAVGLSNRTSLAGQAIVAYEGDVNGLAQLELRFRLTPQADRGFQAMMVGGVGGGLLFDGKSVGGHVGLSASGRLGSRLRLFGGLRANPATDFWDFNLYVTPGLGLSLTTGSVTTGIEALGTHGFGWESDPHSGVGGLIWVRGRIGQPKG